MVVWEEDEYGKGPGRTAVLAESAVILSYLEKCWRREWARAVGQSLPGNVEAPDTSRRFYGFRL